jgi:hypothetical protein
MCLAQMKWSLTHIRIGLSAELLQVSALKLPKAAAQYFPTENEQLVAATVKKQLRPKTPVIFWVMSEKQWHKEGAA